MPVLEDIKVDESSLEELDFDPSKKCMVSHVPAGAKSREPVRCTEPAKFMIVLRCGDIGYSCQKHIGVIRTSMTTLLCGQCNKVYDSFMEAVEDILPL